jgi:hypothetical protein
VVFDQYAGFLIGRGHAPRITHQHIRVVEHYG